MNPITTVMRQCRLFDGIPEEKYQNVLACLRGETKLFRKDAILLQIGEGQAARRCDGWDAADLPV